MRLMIIAWLVFLAMPTFAKVDNQSEQHFVIKHEFTVDIPVTKVFQKFKQVELWWEGSHSFTGDASNLYFDFDKQRCYCEQIPTGGFVEHLSVIHVTDNQKVVFSGGLGPLQDHPVSGKLIWQFEQQDNKTKVSLEYRVFGFIVGGMDKWPSAVDYVLGVQVKRLEQLLTKK